MNPELDRRPILLAIAGPNGAGKSTFFEAHVRPAGLRFVNADELASELGLDPYAAAAAASSVRRVLLERRESFAFETVFSDPAGEKLDLLIEATGLGYTVVLCFIGLDSPERSEERVAMRVLQGGHDVPSDKIASRYPRVLTNLRRALPKLPLVLLFDNSDLSHPFTLVGRFEEGRLIGENLLPAWVPWP